MAAEAAALQIVRSVCDASGQAMGQLGQQKAGEIVHGKAEFMAVGTDAPLRAVVARADAGIADEKVELLVIGDDRIGKFAHVGERRQVRLIEPRGATSNTEDLVD